MANELDINKLEDSAAGRALAAAANAPLQPFVAFTSDLIRNVFRTLVDSSIEQLEAYAELVSKVSGTLADYEFRVLGDDDTQEGRAVDFVNQSIGVSKSAADATVGTVAVVTAADLSSGSALFLAPGEVEDVVALFAGVTATIGTSEKTFSDSLVVTRGTATNAIVSASIPGSELKAFALAKLKKDVKSSYDILVTILKLGLQKLVVTDGRIRTALTFHTDATDSDERSTTNSSSSFYGRSSGFGGSLGGSFILRSLGVRFGFGGGVSRNSTSTSVSVVNEKSSAVTNLSIDITGEVELKFRSDFFPSFDPSAPTPAAG